ncbi:MAG: putative geopeptide radical SAM maturase [Geobacter sp.]|nr:putative geopeptide radical SAM maturase [Geobacter sp.]
MELSRYLKIYPSPKGEGRLLLFSTRRGAVLELPAAMMEAARLGELAGETAEKLALLDILVPSREEEREEMLSLFDNASRRSRRFTALVTLNLDCNLACGYCYEDPFRGKRYMSEETADLLCDRLIDQHMSRGKDLVLEFYGGEPLLSIPLIRRISRRLLDAAKSEGRGYAFNLVSNGTLLTRSTAEELVALGLKGVKFTLDGPRSIHDRQRPFVSGNGSFDCIVNNLKDVCSLVSVQLGGNFTQDNFHEFPFLLDHLLDQGVTPDRITSVLFAPITPKAGKEGIADFSTGCASICEPWLVDASLFLRREILRRGFNTPKPLPAGCMVEFTNSLVVACDGSLFKCPAFMGWRELRIGSLVEGIADYHESHRLDIWKNKECLECPYLPLCFGGCRFLRKLQTGTIDGVDCRRDYLDATLEAIIRQDMELRHKRLL